MSAVSTVRPAAVQASRTAWVSVASQTTSKASSTSLTSSAPASSTASRTSSSVSPSVLARATMPLRWNRYDTEPGSAGLPPFLVIAVRTSALARLRLSVRHSTRIATPPWP